ncbi:MAG: LacI family DNA-binding transcriptional regulator [Sphingobacteriia bacterium]|nr:LacI family DNA-binding transcriptional regulator [Sphingobacteriia bacterium]
MPEKLPTIKEIAKRLNISPSSVSRALHNHPSIGISTKEKVVSLAKELGYEPNQTAIFFQKRKTFTIGVILPKLSEAFFSEAISGIEDFAAKHKYTVLVGQSHNNFEKEKKIIETMKDHRVDGIIVSVAKNTFQYSHFEALKKYNIPVVFFDCIPDTPNIDAVECDMIDGTVKAINFLIKKKHKVIGFINGPAKLPASQQRLQGYKIAMQKNRLKFDPQLIVNTDLTPAGTEQAMFELLAYKRKPSAIVAFNDYVTLDAVQYARSKGIIVNRDIFFVSYANLPVNHYMAYPPLASIEQFPYEQGEKAMEILLNIIQEKTMQPVKAIIEPQLMLNNQLVL